MKLYEIDAAIMAALDDVYSKALDPETGELVNADYTEVEALEAERGQKIENIALYVKNLDSDAEEIKAEEKRLKERRESKERKAESIRQFLSGYMLKIEQPKYETPRVAVSFRKSTAVEVSNMEALPAEYVKVVTTTSPDKVALKAALKAGGTVAGAALVEKQNLQIK